MLQSALACPDPSTQSHKLPTHPVCPASGTAIRKEFPKIPSQMVRLRQEKRSESPRNRSKDDPTTTPQDDGRSPWTSLCCLSSSSWLLIRQKTKSSPRFHLSLNKLFHLSPVTQQAVPSVLPSQAVAPSSPQTLGDCSWKTAWRESAPEQQAAARSTRAVTTRGCRVHPAWKPPVDHIEMRRKSLEVVNVRRNVGQSGSLSLRVDSKEAWTGHLHWWKPGPPTKNYMIFNKKWLVGSSNDNSSALPHFVCCHPLTILLRMS